MQQVPLTNFCQLAHLIQIGMSTVENVKQCYEKKCCTYNSTQNVFAPQTWYQCLTCGLSGDEGTTQYYEKAKSKPKN